MRVVLSYCLYGTAEKYCRGMLRNLVDCAEQFPDADVWIVLGSDVPETYRRQYATFPNARLIPVSETGGVLMTYRFFCIDDPSVDAMIVRDADSRLTARDTVCIRTFLSTGAPAFTIRDHPFHGRKIMGGQWGLRAGRVPSLREAYSRFCATYSRVGLYNSDQDFLDEVVYPRVVHEMIVFSDGMCSPGETCLSIPIPRSSDYDFCGNVWLFDGDLEYPEFTVHGHATKRDFLRSIRGDSGTVQSYTGHPAQCSDTRCP
jgi:hypothetical protein